MRKEEPTTTEPEVLQIAGKAVSDSVGPDGLVPTFIVNSTLPRSGLLHDSPTPSTYQRAMALRKAAEVMTRNYSKR